MNIQSVFLFIYLISDKKMCNIQKTAEYSLSLPDENNDNVNFYIYLLQYVNVFQFLIFNSKGYFVFFGFIVLMEQSMHRLFFNNHCLFVILFRLFMLILTSWPRSRRQTFLSFSASLSNCGGRKTTQAGNTTRQIISLKCLYIYSALH